MQKAIPLIDAFPSISSENEILHVCKSGSEKRSFVLDFVVEGVERLWGLSLVPLTE